MALDERSGQLGREVGQRRVRFDLLGSRMDAYFAPIAFDIADPARLDKHYPASKPNAQGLARVGLEPLERAAQRVVQVRSCANGFTRKYRCSVRYTLVQYSTKPVT